MGAIDGGEWCACACACACAWVLLVRDGPSRLDRLFNTPHTSHDMQRFLLFLFYLVPCLSDAKWCLQSDFCTDSSVRAMRRSSAATSRSRSPSTTRVWWPHSLPLATPRIDPPHLDSVDDIVSWDSRRLSQSTSRGFLVGLHINTHPHPPPSTNWRSTLIR